MLLLTREFHIRMCHVILCCILVLSCILVLYLILVFMAFKQNRHHNLFTGNIPPKLHPKDYEHNYTSPNVGLEPTTLRLRVSCSTD